MKKQNRLLRVLSRLNGRLNGKQKNATDLLNRQTHDLLNVLATRPSQQGALPRFLRRSDRSSLRNPNR